MFTNKKISFIGSGAMGSAMVAGLIRNGIAKPANIVAADPLPELIEALQKKFGVRTTQENISAVDGADVIVLSIKPQRLDAVFHDLHDKIQPDALVISIVAGAQVEMLAVGLNHSHIVRAMPNTPAQIGEGITVWTAAETVDENQKQMTRQILQAFGEEIFVEDEGNLDAATALSGTGPAYVFLFMEAMVDAGVHLGFSRKIAEKLVSQTVKGSADYYINTMKNGEVHLAHLRNQVTSPAGTSAAALYYLEKAGFRTAISRAIWAAYERSAELGQGKKTKAPESARG
jgi:pyrroline-5-carboxylate reductase